MRKLYPSFILLVILITACSSNTSNPVVQTDCLSEVYINIDNENCENHKLVCEWNVVFNVNNQSVTISQNRNLNQHYNATSLIPTPVIQFNSWNPATETVDVDVLIHNPYFIDAYDPRLIIYTDDAGHMLVNADGFTPLYETPGGLPVNPFKAYAQYVPRHKFAAHSWHSENLLIKCPNGNFSVSFTLDVSYPGNCEEPYDVTNFIQQSILYDEMGYGVYIAVDVLDWQNDVSEVSLICPEITGASYKRFVHILNNTWYMPLFNTTGI